MNLHLRRKHLLQAILLFSLLPLRAVAVSAFIQVQSVSLSLLLAIMECLILSQHFVSATRARHYVPALSLRLTLPLLRLRLLSRQASDCSYLADRYFNRFAKQQALARDLSVLHLHCLFSDSSSSVVWQPSCSALWPPFR